MKKLILGLTVLSIFAVSCKNEENLPEDNSPANEITISATMEQAEHISRSIFDDLGTFLWQSGDKMSVLNSLGSFSSFRLSSGAGTASARFTGSVPTGSTIGDIAIFPSGQHTYASGVVTVNLPSTYGKNYEEYAVNTNAIMYGESKVAGEAAFAFKHMAGVVHFTLTNFPAGATGVRLTTENQGITGNFTATADASGRMCIYAAAPTATNRSVTLTFAAADTPRDMEFYFPLPIGEYTMLVEYIDANSEAQFVVETSYPRAIEACSILNMPSLRIEDISGGVDEMKIGLDSWENTGEDHGGAAE